MKRLLLLLMPVFLWGEVWTDPWFTGPLLAPSAVTESKGSVSWQPYIFVTNNYGTFEQDWGRSNTPDTWVIQPLVNITYGLASFVDIEVTPAFSFTTSQGSSSLRFNDTPLFISFQALRDKKGSWIPDLRIRIQETLPFGQCDKLNPKKHGTDGTGKGSYRTGITFNFQKLFKMAPEHYFRLRWTAEWIFYSTPAHIQGLSTYGGSPQTDGRAFPGQSFIAYLSGEYTITHNWGFAFDTLYTLDLKDRFSGDSGGATVGNPIRQQISFAPAIEYNYSANFGIIGGAWFTLAGQNTPQFYSGTISAVISY